MLDLTITFVLLQVIIKHLLGLVYLGKEITFQARFDLARFDYHLHFFSQDISRANTC